MPAITYVPDDDPVDITIMDAGFELVGPLGSDAIVKAITAAQIGEFTVVDHELRNEGWTPVRCAPWAITQLVPGGTAYLPQQLVPADEDGVLPNRHIVLWPYTDLSMPEVTISQEQVTVHASDRRSKSKVGIPNRLGWIAYALGDELFVKWSAVHRDSELYVDRGVSVECYRDERFIEMETLGPLVTLQPGKRAVHREIWTLLDISGDTDRRRPRVSAGRTGGSGIVTYFIGVDSSTTATKALLMDEQGAVVAIGRSEYDFESPRPLWSEQSPDLWWDATVVAIREALAQAGIDGDAVAGIGLTGQMHGLVLLDEDGHVLRPSILWNDQRTQAECDEIRERVGPSELICHHRQRCSDRIHRSQDPVGAQQRTRGLCSCGPCAAAEGLRSLPAHRHLRHRSCRRLGHDPVRSGRSRLVAEW